MKCKEGRRVERAREFESLRCVGFLIPLVRIETVFYIISRG